MFVTGHGKDGKIDLDWTALLQPRQTVAIYMGLRNVEPLMRQFIARGADPDLPAAIIDNATRQGQRVVVGTLGTLAAKARGGRAERPLDHHRRDGRQAAGHARLALGTPSRCLWPESGRSGADEREGLRWFLAMRSTAALAAIPGPDGRAPLPDYCAISGVTIRDDKVFAAIAIDPARAKVMEPMRAEAEAAIRAIPGVKGAVVTLMAEAARGAGGAARGPCP